MSAREAWPHTRRVILALMATEQACRPAVRAVERARSIGDAARRLLDGAAIAHREMYGRPLSERERRRSIRCFENWIVVHATWTEVAGWLQEAGDHAGAYAVAQEYGGFEETGPRVDDRLMDLARAAVRRVVKRDPDFVFRCMLKRCADRSVRS